MKGGCTKDVIIEKDRRCIQEIHLTTTRNKRKGYLKNYIEGGGGVAEPR